MSNAVENRRYLGVDLGDGETAVAYLGELQSNPEIAKLGGAQSSILSAVGEVDGIIDIGEDVLLDAEAKNCSVRFKSRFLTGGEEAERDVQRFAEGLRRRLETYNGEFNLDEAQIVLGCPAGWFEEKYDADRRRYVNLVRRVFPRLKEVPVSESRAAFLFAKHTNGFTVEFDQSELDELLRGSVLVIDIGSSTTDLAYIVEGREVHMGVFGEVRLGGGLIDQYLLARSVGLSARCAELRALFERSPSERSRCEVTARRVKERFFTALAKGEEANVSGYTGSIYYGTGREHCDIKIEAAPQIMDELLAAPMAELEDRSFCDELDVILERALRVTRDAPPALVILTGGASCMPFFREAVAAKFPEAKIAMCTEPEFSIARGLALACRTDGRMAEFRESFARMMEEKPGAPGPVRRAVLDHMGELVVPYWQRFSKYYAERILVPVREQYPRLPEEQRNAAGLRELLRDATERFMREDEAWQREERELLDGWQRKAMRELNEEIRKLCASYGIAGEDIPVAQLRFDLRIPELDAGALTRMLLRLGNVLGGAVQGWILQFAGRGFLQRAEQSVYSQISDPNGSFAAALCDALVEALNAEIRSQVEAVELPIQ